MAACRRPGIQGLEASCVAQLQEVVAGIGMLDAGVRMVLQAQADFVLELFAEEVAHADMGGEVEAGREILVIGHIAAVEGVAEAQACLGEER